MCTQRSPTVNERSGSICSSRTARSVLGGVGPEELEAAASVLHAGAKKEQLAAFKVPRTWVFVDAFPLTGSGKVQKFVLREQYLAGELGP